MTVMESSKAAERASERASSVTLNNSIPLALYRENYPDMVAARDSQVVRRARERGRNALRCSGSKMDGDGR